MSKIDEAQRREMLPFDLGFAAGLVVFAKRLRTFLFVTIVSGLPLVILELVSRLRDVSMVHVVEVSMALFFVAFVVYSAYRPTWVRRLPHGFARLARTSSPSAGWDVGDEDHYFTRLTQAIRLSPTGEEMSIFLSFSLEDSESIRHSVLIRRFRVLAVQRNVRFHYVFFVKEGTPIGTIDYFLRDYSFAESIRIVTAADELTGEWRNLNFFVSSSHRCVFTHRRDESGRFTGYQISQDPEVVRTYVEKFQAMIGGSAQLWTPSRALARESVTG